jgi:hypothetical protein
MQKPSRQMTLIALRHAQNCTNCAGPWRHPPALAWTASIPRRMPSGAAGDTDTFGAQQHAPLLDIEVPI